MRIACPLLVVLAAPVFAQPAAAQGERKPPLFTLDVSLTTTWRSYCARPGVTGCGEYDALEAGSRPPGELQTFRSSAPYLGYLLTGELFPLSPFQAWWSGFGLGSSVGHGFASTRVQSSNGSGSGPSQHVNAVALTVSVDALYRWHFPFGPQRRLGFLGAHAGYRTQRFEVDPAAPTLLASSLRGHPQVGLDAKLPLTKWAQVEVTAGVLIASTPSAETVARFGADVTGLGFRGALALSGEVWGPLSYLIGLSWDQYRDQFTGSGTHWISGGASEERYASLSVGVSARF